MKILQFKKNQLTKSGELCELTEGRGRRSLFINELKESPDYADRVGRIKESLKRIEQLMTEIKEKSK